jgi:hypothetical protein
MPASNILRFESSRKPKPAFVIPKYVREHKWTDGITSSWHWAAPGPAIAAGFMPDYEVLGTDHVTAFPVAKGYFAKLQEFRANPGSLLIDHKAGPVVGTMFWLKDTYVDEHRGLELLKEITINFYERSLQAACNHVFRGGPYQGSRLGDIPVDEVDRKLAKQFRREFLPRPGQEATEEDLSDEYVPPSRKRAKRIRQTYTRHVINTLRSAHNEMQDEYPEWIPEANPWIKMRMKVSQGRTPTATPAMTKQFVLMANSIGESSVGYLIMVAHVWLDRAKCLPTELTIEDYRPSYRPDEVRVYQSKQDKYIWMPLKDVNGKLYFPRLTKRLDALKKQMRSGPLIPARIVNGVGEPWTPDTLSTKIRKICDLCGFPKNISLRSFRKGGIVQSGEAGLTHTQIKGQTGHSSGVVDRYLEMTMPVLQAGFRARAQDLHRRAPGIF